MSQRGRTEARANREARARSLAGFFVAGAVLSTTVLLLPGWEQMHTLGIAVTVVAALVGALVLFLAAELLGPAATHVMTVSGTVLIGACQVFAGGGSPTAMYAMLYIWVILHAALFSSRVGVGAHLGFSTIVHAGALLWLDDVTAIGPQLALTLVTQVAAALIVGSLATKQRELADTDALTGLRNRRVAEGTLEWAMARSRRHPASPTWVALLDLDGFKVFNDEQGHLAGDLVLVDTAAAWRTLVRSTDTLARTGGDEFMLVLIECDLDEAHRIVRRMVAATPGGVTCSAGLARWDGHETRAALVDRADQALYLAKSGGPAVALAPDPDRDEDLAHLA